ncbi:hypothetical protein LEP1GSC195_1112 [Leptospira wolbachii serovar Codice str. CDC]|uniref:Oligosaccharide repeat unit polymerase n=2 Tax=Leptospira TaxID=171 RepID=R9A7Y6_9LEPT|nr:hypothetical protein LEP1GSC195_1112 [Leptospira wolbachii serovar Codice str. CDC]
MGYQSIQIIIFYVVVLFLLNRISYKYSIFAAVIVSWWFLWNFISSTSITNLFVIGQKTQNLYYIFFSGLVLGAIIWKLLRSRSSFEYLFIIPKYRLKYIVRAVFLFYVLVIVPITIYFLARGLYLMSTEFTVREYRSEVFGLWTGSSKLFHNSKMISIFYFWIVNPFQVASVFLGVSFRNIGNDNRLFYVAILLLFFDAIILAGRFALHSLISVFLITLLLDLFSSHSREFFYRKNKYLFLFIGFILFFLMVFTMLRDNSGLSGFVDSLKLYIFIYHTESFSILDHELLNPSSIIHDLTYGKSFFGGVLKYPILLMNQLGFNIISEESRIGGYLHKNFAIGINEDGSLIQLNAFGSIFFSMYRDGREFFIFLCGIFYGYNLLFFSQRFYSRSVLGVSLLVSMLFIGIYGIFQPYIDGAILPSLLISSIILIVLNFYYKRIV